MTSFKGYLKGLLFIISLIAFQSVTAQTKTITFTKDATTAYQLVMQLRLKEAQQMIDKVKKETPDNYVVYFLENYIDFFTIFIGENSADFKKLKENKDKRLEMIGKTDPRSPYYLYCKAEINLQWALVRLKFEEYTKAFF